MDNQIKIKKKSAFQFFISLCLITALIYTMSPCVFAVAEFDVNTPCSVTLDCSSNSNGMGNMLFHLYRVADGSEATGFTLSGDFAEYRVNLRNLDDSGWSAAAYTLAAYTVPDNIQPIQSATANGSRYIDFDKLSNGLYLLVGESVTINDNIYTAVPTLVSLPDLQADNTWIYDLNIKPKFVVQNVLNPHHTVDVSVVKIWNDDGHTEMRPDSIEINLLCNGKLYERRNLTAEDYWRHTWMGLSSDCNWSVVERNVSDEYTVISAADNTMLTITNTSTNKTYSKPDTKDWVTSNTLPQTGLLWWPVSLMAASGSLIFGFGWRRYFIQDKENHEE